MGTAMAASRQQRGVTLIEAVLFLSVSLGLVVGGLVLFRQAGIAATTQQTVRLVTTILAETRMLNERGGGFLDASGVLDIGELLIASGAVPARSVADHGTGLQTPWQTDMSIARRPLQGAGFTRCLRLEIDDVPPEICTRIAQFDARGIGVLGRGIYIMQIGKRRFYSDMYASVAHGKRRNMTIGLSPAEASRACADGSGLVDILISFAIR